MCVCVCVCVCGVPRAVCLFEKEGGRERERERREREREGAREEREGAKEESERHVTHWYVSHDSCDTHERMV